MSALADVSLLQPAVFSAEAPGDLDVPSGAGRFLPRDYQARARALLRGPGQSQLQIEPVSWNPSAADDDSAAYAGVPPHGSATIGGMRVATADAGVACMLTAPGSYSFLGAANVDVSAITRAVRLSGQNLLVTMPSGGVEVVNGTIRVGPGGRSYQVESGAVRPMRDLPLPAIGSTEAQALGRTIDVRRLPGGQLYVTGIDPRAPNQGDVGDCWLISALISMAAMRPDLIERMVIDNGDHTYTVRFPGAAPVTVDDRFYQRTDPYAVTTFVYASGTSPRELWGPIIEKAYAMLDGRGYQSIWGGYPDAAFRTLTGVAATTQVNRAISADQLYQLIARNEAARNPMVAISGSAPPAGAQQLAQAWDLAARRTIGLRNWHGYAVLGTQMDGGQRYVIVRNTSNWDVKFKTNAYSTDVDYRGRSGASSGIFRMRIDDFQRYFYQTTTLPLS